MTVPVGKNRKACHWFIVLVKNTVVVNEHSLGKARWLCTLHLYVNIQPLLFFLQELANPVL